MGQDDIQGRSGSPVRVYDAMKLSLWPPDCSAVWKVTSCPMLQGFAGHHWARKEFFPLLLLQDLYFFRLVCLFGFLFVFVVSLPQENWVLATVKDGDFD